MSSSPATDVRPEHVAPSPGEPREGAGPLPARSRIAASPLIARLSGLLGVQGSGRVLAAGAATSFGVQIASMALGLMLQLVIARTVGVAEYGVYLYVLAWLNTALLPGKVEFDLTAIRHVGAYTAQERWPLLHGFLRRSFLIVAALSSGIAILGVLLAWLLSDRLRPGGATAVLVAAPMLPATALLLLSGASLQGLGKVLEAQIPNLVFRPLLFAILLASAVLVGRTLDAPAAIVFNLIATLSAMVLSMSLLRRETPPAARTAPPAYETRAWMRASLTLMLIATFQLAISQQSDVLFVGTIVGTTGAGLYGAASQLSALVAFASTAIGFMSSPMMARLHARGDHAELQRLLHTVTRLNAACGAPLALGMIAIGPFALGLFGAGFRSVYPVLVILTANQLVAAAVGGTAGMLLAMTGRQNAAARMVGVSALVNVVLTIPLTKLFGLPGTAIATIIATTLRSLLLERYCRRELGLSIVPLGRAPA